MSQPGSTPQDLWTDKPTGAVYKWPPGSAVFRLIEGTELTGNNGIEISPDGEILYVVNMTAVTRFSNTNPAKLLGTVHIEEGLGDNIHWVDGQLVIAASRLVDCPPSGPGFGCMTGYHVSAVNPETLEVQTILTGENTAEFSGVSVALPLDGKLWLGSFASDRAAYRTLP